MAAVDVQGPVSPTCLPEHVSTSNTTAGPVGACCDDVVAILPKHTRVLVTGNNRTKRALVGQEAVVKKAVGLGGWHWLVLGNGEEVKLQRNALAVLEYGPDDLQESSSDEQTDTRDTHIEILTRPRVRRPPRSLSPGMESPPRRLHQATSRQLLAPHHHHHQQQHHHSGGSTGTSAGVNLHHLATPSLKKYRRVYHMCPLDPAWSREELLDSVSQHWRHQEVEEGAVLTAFLAALQRQRTTAAIPQA